MRKIFGIYPILLAGLAAGLVLMNGCATAPKRIAEQPKVEAVTKSAALPAAERLENAAEKTVSPAVSTQTVTLMPAAEVKKKYLILIADWGKNGPTDETVNIIYANPKLALTIPWPYGVVPSTRVVDMAKNGQIEPVLTLAEEPVLPMIYDTKISSNPPLEFSWPQDVSNIVFKNQEAFKTGFNFLGSGLYLRSGIISKEIFPQMEKLEIKWVNAQIPDGNKWGYFDDKFLVVNARESDIKDAGDFLAWVSAQKNDVVEVVFKDKNQINGDFLSELGKKLSERNDIALITPQRLMSEYEPLIPVNGAWDTPFDPSPWLKNPDVWYKLSVARSEIEKYKNSGSAKIGVLSELRDELYFLYSYDFLSRVQESQDSDDYRLFQARLNNIYTLMDKNESDAEGGFIQSLSVHEDTAAFHIDTAVNKISFHNAGYPDAAVKLKSFSVELTKDRVRYSIELDSSVPAGSAVIDIYMDLNNIPGAGLERFLPDADAFMKQQDAWEYAIRIENNKASLYIASRFNASLVRIFGVKDKYIVEVPRTILRGNPLRWGYQAVTMKKNTKTNKYEISDFLCRDSNTRASILKNKPLQLNAFRGGKSG